MKIGTCSCNVVQQVTPSHRCELLAANFAQNHTAGTSLQLFKQVFEEISHVRQRPAATADAAVSYRSTKPSRFFESGGKLSCQLSTPWRRGNSG